MGNQGTGRSAAAGRADCRKTVHSLNRGSGLGLVVLCERIADRLSQVFREVAHGPVCVGGGGDDAGDVVMGSEPHDVDRSGIRVGVEMARAWRQVGSMTPVSGSQYPAPVQTGCSA